MTRLEAVTALLLIVAASLLFVAVGVAYGQTDPAANQPDFWCEPGQGIKLEPVATPFVVPEPEEGTTWTLLVLKAGTTNETVDSPTPGEGYSHSSGRDISHVILCWEQVITTSTTTTSTTTTTTTTTAPSTSTTTTAPSTTTTDPTTTSSSTTTTDPTTTTTPSTTSTPSETPTTTVPPTTTTPTLPNTGVDALGLAVLGLFLLGVGTLTVLAFGSRR